MFLKGLGLLLVVGLAASEPPVNNQYLPPDNGYNYPKPSVPFPSSQHPNLVPPSPSSYPSPRPPAPRPPPSYPSYPSPAPPRPTYGPPITTGHHSSIAPTRPVGYPSYPSPAPTSPPHYPSPSYGPPTGPSHHGGDHGHDHHHEPGMPFDFNYNVKDDYYGTDFSHNAISDGDVVKGQYRVALPDGRTQIVTYTADWKNGYMADVKYEGEARYPDQAPGHHNNQITGPGSYHPQPPTSGYPGPKPSYGPPTHY